MDFLYSSYKRTKKYLYLDNNVLLHKKDPSGVTYYTTVDAINLCQFLRGGWLGAYCGGTPAHLYIDVP